MHFISLYNRMPKVMLIYRPNGRRGLRRHLKRLYEYNEAEAGLARSIQFRAFSYYPTPL